MLMLQFLDASGQFQSETNSCALSFSANRSLSPRVNGTSNVQPDRQVRELSEAKLPAAAEMETASFPEDEAASPETMQFRRAKAGAFFLEGSLKSVSRFLCAGK